MIDKREMLSLEPSLDYSLLNQAMLGPLQAEVILAAITLQLFDHLAEDKSAAMLAEELALDAGQLGYLLDALVALQLLRKKHGYYWNRTLARDFLVTTSPSYLGAMFLSLAGLRYLKSDEIITLLKAPAHRKKNDHDLSREKVWTKAASYLKHYQRAGIAEQVVTLVSSFPEFPSFKKILDLGGGPGIVGISLVAAHETAEGIIFDLPGVTEAARQAVDEYRLAHRIQVIGGNYNHDSLGSGYDFIFSSLSLYYAEDLGRLCVRIYEALNPGGIFMSYHEGLFHERTEPAEHVLARIGVALRGQDLSFNRGEIAAKMLDAGFCSVRSEPLHTANGMIEVDIARKRA